MKPVLSYNTVANMLGGSKLVLQDAICLTDSFVLTQSQSVNFKAMRHESTGLNKTVDEKSHLALFHSCAQTLQQE